MSQAGPTDAGPMAGQLFRQWLAPLILGAAALLAPAAAQERPIAIGVFAYRG